MVEGGWESGTDILAENPVLQPLGDHGGPTPSMPLSSMSPAINAGSTDAGIPEDDQRGFPRDSAPDIGSCEFLAVLIQSNLQAPYASLGSVVELTALSDFATPTFYWFEGESGDESNPIAGANSASHTSPALVAGEDYWVRISDGGGGSTVDSNTYRLPVRSTYDEWVDFYGLAPGARACLNNPMGDGIFNLLKYAVGFDPTVRCRLEDRVRATYDPGTGKLVFSCTFSKTPSDLSLDFEQSTDLSRWSGTGLNPRLTAGTVSTAAWEISLPCDSPAGFLRLRAELHSP